MFRPREFPRRRVLAGYRNACRLRLDPRHAASPVVCSDRFRRAPAVAGKIEQVKVAGRSGGLFTLELRIKPVSKSPAANTESLGAYLNDHLAGAVAALELIDYIKGHFPASDLEEFLARLHKEVSADQEVVRSLLDGLGVKESTLRKAGAWVMEKAARAKLRLEKHENSGSGLLESLEALVLGITGKQLLWRTLAATAPESLRVSVDFAELERRAVDQRNRAEEQRLRAARLAFGGRA